MTSTPPPSGSDPRVLTPDADEPEVKIAHGYSTGHTYHTADCAIVARMDDPNAVPKSVAEWKGHDKCKRCDERECGEGYPHPGGPTGASAGQRLHHVTRVRCLQIRCQLLRGGSTRGVADATGISKSTVNRHRDGACACEHYGRTLAFDGCDYYPVEDEGVPRTPTGRTSIDCDTCADIRGALSRDGVSANALAAVFGIGTSTLRAHATGDCSHDHGVTPVRYDHDDKCWRTIRPENNV